MNAGMQTELKGIADLLAGARLQVPLHQRAFAWEEPQVSEFLDDIGAAFRDGKKNYFLGSVVTIDAGDKKTARVLDGQQRLATTALLLAGVADRLAELDDARGSTVVRERFLVAYDLEGKQDLPNLRLNNEDDEYFRSILSRKYGPPEANAPQSHHLLYGARNITKQWVLNHYPTGKAAVSPSELAAYLQQRVQIIHFKVTDEADAYLIFETLNDRGLELSTQDLLKNYLLGKAKSDQATVAHNWMLTSHRIKSQEPRTPEKAFSDFLRHFWSSKHGLVREKVLYKRIRGAITTANQVKEFSNELLRNANLYAAIMSADHEHWNGYSPQAREDVETLDMMGLERYRAMLLAALDTMPQKEVEALLRRLVGWNVRLLVDWKVPGGQMETMYADVGKAIREKQLRTAKEVAEHMTFIPSDADFRKSFSGYRVSNVKFAKYLLRALELAQGEADPEKVPSRSLTLEHVLPQNPGKHWPQFDSEAEAAYVKRLGNLVLLQQRVNSNLKSAPFGEKRKAFRTSALATTREVSRKKEWTPAAIEERQERLATIAVKVWPR